MITRRTWLCVVALAASLLGCEDEFLTGAAITRMRLLAGKVVVDGDPERAWFRPGDNGRIELKLAFPGFASDDPRRANPDNPLDPLFPKDRMRDVRSMILTCTKAAIGGQPQCAEVLALFELNRRFQNGELDVDAGLPDGGMPDAPLITPEQVDATFAALERGVGCDDQGEIIGTVDDPNDDIPDDDIPDYIGNAQAGIRLVPSPQAAQLSCVNRAPTTVLSLSDDYVGPDRLVQGVVCEYGEPVFKLAPPFFDCRYEVGSNPALPNRAPIAEVFFYTVGVESDGVSNQHPKFGDTPLRIRDSQSTGQPREWVSDATIPQDCAGVTNPELIRDFGGKSTIRITTEAMRELASTMPEKREVYQVETFSNFGEFERQYSVIDDLDTDPFVDIEWDHGKRPRENGMQVGGKRVDFYFVIRDGRYGVAIETRAFCLCAGKRCPAAPTP